jgi:translation initiation factor 1 (eIF-1/SUI1)
MLLRCYILLFFVTFCLDLKLKDAVKLFGKKFSSGASVQETQTGSKEVVIQGFYLPKVEYYLSLFIISNFYY